MDPIQTNNTLLYSLATFVNQQIESSLEGRFQVSLTDSNLVEIKEKVLADLDDVDAAAVAEKISVCDIAELIDPSDIAAHITARDVAREIDMSEIANEISTRDLAEELSQHLDSSEIAEQVEIDHQELAEYVNDEELANQLASNDDFVESVAKAVANRPGEHTTVTADAVQVTAENLINDKLAAACDRIVERVTQRVLAQIGSTLVALLSGGAKPQ